MSCREFIQVQKENYSEVALTWSAKGDHFNFESSHLSNGHTCTYVEKVNFNSIFVHYVH